MRRYSRGVGSTAPPRFAVVRERPPAPVIIIGHRDGGESAASPSVPGKGEALQRGATVAAPTTQFESPKLVSFPLAGDVIGPPLSPSPENHGTRTAAVFALVPPF